MWFNDRERDRDGRDGRDRPGSSPGSAADSDADIVGGRRARRYGHVVVLKKKVEAASRQQHSDQRQDGEDNGVDSGREGKLVSTQYRRDYIVQECTDT